MRAALCLLMLVVSTHSRPKAAGPFDLLMASPPCVSTHSRPKAAGRVMREFMTRLKFQHTAARRRLEAGFGQRVYCRPVSTHSRPKAAGQVIAELLIPEEVSTHSRPKAAGVVKNLFSYLSSGFNTQPPEGGWTNPKITRCDIAVSTHSRPKAAGRTNRH